MAPKDKSEKKKKLAERDAENQAILEVQQRVKTANAITDLLASYPAFRKYERNDISVEFGFFRGDQLDEETLDWAVNLSRETLGPAYVKNFGHFEDGVKREQLSDPNARLLLFYPSLGDDCRGDPMGFAHFRWEMEGVAPVLYIWDVVMEEVLQRKGLGRFVVQFLDLVARKTDMEWVMTTIPLACDAAFGLFRKVGFAMDMQSPGAVIPDPAQRGKDTQYEIFSKCFLPQDVQQQQTIALNQKSLSQINSKSKQSKMRMQQILLQ